MASGNRLSDLDAAIDCLMADLSAPAPKTGDETTDALNAVVIGKAHAETAKALAILLERRSKLLGLDARPDEKPREPGAEGQDSPIVRAIRAEGDKLRSVR
jgi:hypothetical protein